MAVAIPDVLAGDEARLPARSKSVPLPHLFAFAALLGCRQ